MCKYFELHKVKEYIVMMMGYREKCNILKIPFFILEKQVLIFINDEN